MEQSLRKGLSLISLTYSSGNYTNLQGTKFTAESLEENICFGIDLTPNLKVRNKDTNWCHDALELIEDSSDLESIQIDEKQVIDGLADIYRKSPDSFWQLKLIIENKIFKYEVTPQQLGNSLIFSVS